MPILNSGKIPKNQPAKITDSKLYKQKMDNINAMINQANLNLYGTDRNDEISDLNKSFKKLLDNELHSITDTNSNTLTSFLSKLVSNDNKIDATLKGLNGDALSISGDDYTTMQSFIYDAYRNRYLEQADLHEVAGQLIELSEAIEITRDAIISADIVSGRMNRTLKFDNLDDDEESNSKSIVESLEKKFSLLEKIKDFIVPKTLEYGEYYVYIIPYSKLFGDFSKTKEKMHLHIKESTILESSFDGEDKKNSALEMNNFLRNVYDEFYIQESTKYDKNENHTVEKISFEDFSKDMKNMLGNIKVNNDAIPLPILEEGFESVNEFRELYEKVINEAQEDVSYSGPELFNRVVNAKPTSSEGLIFNDTKRKKRNEFANIGDCYIQMIDPTRIIPLKIMGTIIGYYYVADEDITPLSGAVSSTLYYTKFDEHRREKSIVDAIASLVVKNFDKKFLNQNIKFKEAIADCIRYYNINETKLKFQFIPAEYIQQFAINKDVDGNGQSMISKSLFYAKLYLMLLLFKIMSIILYSNDQRVNYVRNSGIDKNLANQIQEIARIKQQRQINITDLFSYTTLINKVGNGTEQYIPVGASGERPIETEILSGQDVPLNNELMEMLKNAYILATGVPAAIVNYMNEADYAKTIEQNNSKFNGRVVNYQLDLNPCITNMYKMIMRYSSELPDNVIDGFNFILDPPKTVNVNTKAELLNNFQTNAEFLTQLFYEDPSQSMDPNLQLKIREFRKLLVKDMLPMFNLEELEEMVKEANLNAQEIRLKPDALNGDNGDDTGLSDEELNQF